MDDITVDRDLRISTVGRDDYPELEGKIIDYIYAYDETLKGVVVGCNRSLGITIVDVTDKEKYLVCFTGAVVPKPSDFSDKACTYMELFDYTVERIKKGRLFADDFRSFYTAGISLGSCTGANCAYK